MSAIADFVGREHGRAGAGGSGGGAALGSILSVDDGGVYSGITVRIGDDVPRQYCRRVIDGVQVGDIVQWASVIVFQDSSVRISG